MTPEEHKLERAKALASEITDMAHTVATNMTIAFPPKRLFRKKGKRPLKRLKRKRAMIALGMAPGIAKMRLMQIMAQPIPKFPPGGEAPRGLAIVGETGQELMITKNGKVEIQ